MQAVGFGNGLGYERFLIIACNVTGKLIGSRQRRIGSPAGWTLRYQLQGSTYRLVRNR